MRWVFAIGAAATWAAGCGTALPPERGTVEYVPLRAGAPQRAARGARGGVEVIVDRRAASRQGYVVVERRRPPAVDEPVTAPTVVRRRGSTIRVEPMWEARHQDRRASARSAAAQARAVEPARASGAAEVDPETLGPPTAPAWAADDPAPRPEVVPVQAPYALSRVFRGFGGCRGNRHFHEAIDIGGVGPDAGLGTPVRAMTRERVKFIGRPEDRPGEFGVRDRRKGKTTRGGKELPRSKVVPGYGRVYFFTKNHGRWRSGVVLVTEGVGGVLDQHKIRYMHLGAIHPKVRVGSVLEPGQEIGVLGGTAVQRSSPHVHIDIENPDGERVDVAPLLGLAPTARPCPAGKGDRVWTTAVTVDTCGRWERHEDFDSGEYYAHDVNLPLAEGDAFEVELVKANGRWKPRLEVYGADDVTLYNGSAVPRKGRERSVVVRRRLSGRNGPKAVVRVAAKEDTEVRLRVTAWPSKRPGPLLPEDGAYELRILGRCEAATGRGRRSAVADGP